MRRGWITRTITTLDTYAHSLQVNDRQAADEMEALLRLVPLDTILGK